MRRHVICIMIIALVSLNSLGQRTSYYTCEQGISLSHNNYYHLAFQGRKGIDKSALNGYAKNQELSKNQVWLFFAPPSSGLILLNTKHDDLSFSTYILSENSEGICRDFDNGKAKLFFKESNNTQLS